MLVAVLQMVERQERADERLRAAQEKACPFPPLFLFFITLQPRVV